MTFNLCIRFIQNLQSTPITMELCDDVYRFANDEQLTESETCVMEFDKKESTYTMKLTGDVKAKQGKVKVVAKNNGGEASSEADLTTSGRLPELSAKPIKCAVLEGMNRAVFKKQKLCSDLH